MVTSSSGTLFVCLQEEVDYSVVQECGVEKQKVS